MNKGVELIASNIDIEPILYVLPECSSDVWDKWDLRQTKFKFPHSNTKTIPIKWNNEYLKVYKELNEVVKPYVEFLEEYYNNNSVNVMFALLKPHSDIALHTDNGYLRNVYRCHYPIKTSEKIIFTANYMLYNLKVGSLYRLFNQTPHSVSNPTDECRIHLIVDILKQGK